MVIWSGPAKSDLRAIFDFIAQNSKFYAKKVLHEIVERAEVLETLPRSGRIVQELSNPDIREIGVYSYRIIYEIRNVDTFILAVVHRRREIQSDSIFR